MQLWLNDPNNVEKLMDMKRMEKKGKPHCLLWPLAFSSLNALLLLKPLCRAGEGHLSVARSLSGRAKVFLTTVS